MEENHFDINIFSVFVQKVLQEVGHRLVGDVATNNNVPVSKLISNIEGLLTFQMEIIIEIDLKWILKGNGSCNMHEWDLESCARKGLS